MDFDLTGNIPYWHNICTFHKTNSKNSYIYKLAHWVILTSHTSIPCTDIISFHDTLAFLLKGHSFLVQSWYTQYPLAFESLVTSPFIPHHIKKHLLMNDYNKRDGNYGLFFSCSIIFCLTFSRHASYFLWQTVVSWPWQCVGSSRCFDSLGELS